MEGLYYLYSENKGADQLRAYREADLRLCFRICKKPVFMTRLIFKVIPCSKQKPNKVTVYISLSKLCFNMFTIKKMSERQGIPIRCSFKLVASGGASFFVKVYSCILYTFCIYTYAHVPAGLLHE